MKKKNPNMSASFSKG